MAIMKAFEDALGIHSQLLKEGENAIALDRAITLSVRARVLQNTGRGNEARADLDEAIRIVEKSVADGQSKSARFLPRLKRQLDAAIHGKKFDDQE
jgi:tetratricopeptide (TPR) repeat protein